MKLLNFLRFSADVFGYFGTSKKYGIKIKLNRDFYPVVKKLASKQLLFIFFYTNLE